MNEMVEMGVVEMGKDAQELRVQVTRGGGEGVGVEFAPGFSGEGGLVTQQLLGPRHHVVDLSRPSTR